MPCDNTYYCTDHTKSVVVMRVCARVHVCTRWLIIINEAEIDALQFFTYLVLWNDNMADSSFAKRSSFLDVHACF
jgi:hypothetical protein